MKRINTLSVCGILALFTSAVACASGGEDPDTAGSGASTSTSGGSTGTSGSTGSSGSTGTTGGTTSGSGGTTSSSGGTTSSGGGTTSSGGSTSGGITGVCSTSQKGVHVLTEDEGFVDNFEDDTRWTGWYSYAAVPTAGTDMKVERVTDGATGTAMGAHVANTDINTGTDKFGAGVGFNMRDAADACADISNFDGVSFWAKAATGTTTYKFLAVVPAASATMDGGDCVSNCYNHPGKDLTLTTEWAHYTIKWSDLTGPVPISNNLILALQWITTGPDVDFAIDEITLFKGTAPDGAVEAPGAGGAGGN